MKASTRAALKQIKATLEAERNQPEIVPPSEQIADLHQKLWLLVLALLDEADEK